jgi:hypothetical protein
MAARPHTERSPAREELRGVLGDDVVDRLTDAQAGRLLGVLFAAARRELERFDQIPGQLDLDAA